MSKFDQSLVGFRLLHHHCTVRVRIEFDPRTWQQSAGLGLYYNTSNFYFAAVSSSDDGSRCVQLTVCDNRKVEDLLAEPLLLPASGPVELEARLDGESLRFFVVADAKERALGPELDATILSDDHPMDAGVGWAFTGPFAVLAAQDRGDARVPADFDDFAYTSP
jgi:xylan 1,4-beta-xylosidase